MFCSPLNHDLLGSSSDDDEDGFSGGGGGNGKIQQRVASGAAEQKSSPGSVAASNVLLSVSDSPQLSGPKAGSSPPSHGPLVPSVTVYDMPVPPLLRVAPLLHKVVRF